jgi:hypothetical protein
VGLSLEETTDIYLVGDFRPEMPEVSGIFALGQRLLLRLTTPRGLFPWWPEDGLDVRQYTLSKEPEHRMAGAIDAECRKDEQVESTFVRVTTEDGGARRRVEIQVFSPLGTFKMTLGITEAAATLLALEQAA